MDIKVLLIEVAHFVKDLKGGKDEFETFMNGIGYSLHKSLFIDDIYVKKDFVLPKKLKTSI